MKKILKKLDIKTIIILCCLITFNSSIFFLSKLLLKNPHLIGCQLDNNIPFLPEFVYIYIAWYIALIVIPYYVAKKNRSSFNKYVITYIISTIICGIVFISYPNTIKRANITESGLSATLVKIIYMLDTPVNCFPSIHCLYAYLFTLSIIDTKKETSIYIKLLVAIFSILVVLSTLFIKQHVIYDAFASLIIAILVWSIVSILKKEK